MMQTEQGDKTVIDLTSDGFEMRVFPKEQTALNGEFVQDICQLRLKPTNAKRAFNRLKSKQKYKPLDGKSTVWLTGNKLTFKFEADYFPQGFFKCTFSYFFSARIMECLAGFTGSLPAPTLNTQRKVGRNDACPCGSGRKYKRCCLALGLTADQPDIDFSDSWDQLQPDPPPIKIPDDLQPFVTGLSADRIFDLIKLATDYPAVKKDPDFWLCLSFPTDHENNAVNDQSIACLRQAIELQYEFLPARCILASTLHHQQRFNEAADILEPVKSFDIEISDELTPFAQFDDVPTLIHVYMGADNEFRLLESDYWIEMGQVVGTLGKHDLALNALTKALSIDPDSYGAKVNLVVTYKGLERTNEALQLIDQIIADYSPAKRSKNDRPPYLFKANILHGLGRYLEAIPLYEQAISEEPDFYLPYINLIDSLAHTGHPFLEYWLEKAIHNVPISVEIAITYCHFLKKHNRLIELSQADWIDHIEPEGARLDIIGRTESNLRLVLESQLYRNIGQYLDSADLTFLLAAAERLESADKEWHLCDLARYLYVLLARREAIDQVPIAYNHICDDCRQNDASLPQHSDTIAALGHMFGEEFESAVSIFEQVLQNDPDCLHSLLGYWWSLDEVGRVKEALEVAKKAYHHPLFDSYSADQELPIASLAYNIGWLSGKGGQFGQAAHYYQQQLERDSAHAFSLENLSFIHLLQQDLDSARRLFNQSFQCREQEIRKQIDELSLEQGADTFFNIAEYEEFKAAKQSQFDFLMSFAEKNLGTPNFTADLIELNNQGDYQIGAYTGMLESRFDMESLLKMIRTNPHDKGEIDNVTFQVEMEGRGDYSILVQPIKERIGNLDILPIEAKASIIEAEYRLAGSDKL